MPPIRLAGCRETQAWTYAKTTLKWRFNRCIIFLLLRFVYIDKKSSRVRIPTEPLSFLMIRRVIACESNSSVRLWRPILSIVPSLSGIRFYTRVRYVSAGLNNLKSELSISVNCYTSVNVDLSMSLNCSFLFGVCMCALRTVNLQGLRKAIRVRLPYTPLIYMGS